MKKTFLSFLGTSFAAVSLLSATPVTNQTIHCKCDQENHCGCKTGGECHCTAPKCKCGDDCKCGENCPCGKDKEPK